LYQQNKQKMKVAITYTEVQHFTMTKEVEMTDKEYKEHLKMTDNELNHKHDLTALCGNEYHVITEVLSVDIEKKTNKN